MITPIIPKLTEIGVDVLNPIQPACIDPANLKRQFGDKLCFWGSIDEQHTLPFGSPFDVRDEVMQRLETIGKNGGLILAPTHLCNLTRQWKTSGPCTKPSGKQLTPVGAGDYTSNTRFSRVGFDSAPAIRWVRSHNTSRSFLENRQRSDLLPDSQKQCAGFPQSKVPDATVSVFIVQLETESQQARTKVFQVRCGLTDIVISCLAYYCWQFRHAPNGARQQQGAWPMGEAV
jgi:hypothetical protein